MTVFPKVNNCSPVSEHFNPKLVKPNCVQDPLQCPKCKESFSKTNMDTFKCLILEKKLILASLGLNRYFHSLKLPKSKYGQF